MIAAAMGDSYAIVAKVVCLRILYSPAAMKTLRLLWALHPWLIFVKYSRQRQSRGPSALTLFAVHLLMVFPSRTKDEDWHGSLNL